MRASAWAQGLAAWADMCGLHFVMTRLTLKLLNPLPPCTSRDAAKYKDGTATLSMLRVMLKRHRERLGWSWEDLQSTAKWVDRPGVMRLPCFASVVLDLLPVCPTLS